MAFFAKQSAVRGRGEFQLFLELKPTNNKKDPEQHIDHAGGEHLGGETAVCEKEGGGEGEAEFFDDRGQDHEAVFRRVTADDEKDYLYRHRNADKSVEKLRMLHAPAANRRRSWSQENTAAAAPPPERKYQRSKTYIL